MLTYGNVNIVVDFGSSVKKSSPRKHDEGTKFEQPDQKMKIISMVHPKLYWSYS